MIQCWCQDTGPIYVASLCTIATVFTTVGLGESCPSHSKCLVGSVKCKAFQNSFYFTAWQNTWNLCNWYHWLINVVYCCNFFWCPLPPTLFFVSRLRALWLRRTRKFKPLLTLRIPPTGTYFILFDSSWIDFIIIINTFASWDKYIGCKCATTWIWWLD